MKNGLFNINLFVKYKTRIEEINYRGCMIWGASFIGVFILDFFIKLLVNPEAINNTFVFFMLVCGALMLILRTCFGKTKNIVTVSETLWYILGICTVIYVGIAYEGRPVFIGYGTVSIMLSLLLLVEPFYLIIGQLCGASLLIITISVAHEEPDIFVILWILILCLIAIIAGLVACFMKVENLVFKEEIEGFSSESDDSFVETRSDPEWEGRNKYGILSGRVSGVRRIFTFVVSIPKRRLEHIRENNVFKISEGTDWNIAKNKIIALAFDSESRSRLERFLDTSAIERNHKTGHSRSNILAGFCLADGEKIWLDMECVVRPHPLTGELLATIACEDITEERIMMGVLNRIMEKNYDCDFCFEKDRDNTIKFVALPGEEIKGEYCAGYETIMRDYIGHAVAPEECEEALRVSSIETIVAELEKSDVYNFTLNVQTGDKVRRKLFTACYLEPTKQFINVIRQDVTEVIAKEEEQRKELQTALHEKDIAMSMQNEFMTRMSHEMRTPMNAILGLSMLIQDEINNPNALNDYVKKIQYSGQFLLQLISDVLDMSKMEQSKFKLKLESYSFGEFWEAIDMMIEPMCLNKKLDFEWRSSIPESVYVRTDKLRVTQVFVNLLSNAVKYTPEGGHILFECREIGREGKKVTAQFSVVDDGIGMSREFQKHLFEPFSQESKVVDSNLNGTGLGLAIVKGIVDALGGKIDVISKQGKGSTFIVTLTFEIAKEGPRVRPITVEKDISGKRLLVVEDNDINREIAVAILEKKGVIVETAANGEEAIRIFSEHEPGYYDLILMDIRMPVMNGLEATKAIRKLEREDAAKIPIIAMTANALEKDIKASVKAGLNEHLSKPIEPKILYDTIARYVNVQ